MDKPNPPEQWRRDNLRRDEGTIQGSSNEGIVRRKSLHRDEGTIVMDDDESVQQHVIITLKNAELTENFIMFGKMDPYATVEWIDGKSNQKKLISRTHTDWNSHFHPVWDFTCRGQKYRLKEEEATDDMVSISVYQDDGRFLGSKLMGTAKASVKKLLGLSLNNHQSAPPKSFGLLCDNDGNNNNISGPMLELHLTKNGSGKIIGKIFVETRLAVVDLSEKSDALTRVDRDMFEVPVERLSVAGGTAPFFKLTLSTKELSSRPYKSCTSYIGKDLRRASNEVAFYEELIALKKQHSESGDSNDGLRFLLDFTFEYLGIFTAFEKGCPESEPPKELLVFTNLNDGCESLRKLDLKIGKQTAQGGWQGKSILRAWKQYIIDGTTNSATEGYRLECIQNGPQSLLSREPLMDIPGYSSEALDKIRKKARRFLFQHLTADQIFMYFLHFRPPPPREEDDENFEPPDDKKFYTSVELSELVLHELVQRLILLSVACHRVKIPQKWIGSSVGIGFDSECVYPRSVDPDFIRSRVHVNIFDWGRSELNTVEKHMHSSKNHDHSLFWGYYKEGIDMLSWNAARTYFRHFSCKSWTEIEIKVIDFDMHQRDEFLGKITLPVQNTAMAPFTLRKEDGVSAAGSILLSIEWWDAPEDSRLSGAWRIFISNAFGLINKDIYSSSDVYCLITAKSPTRCFQQVTSVKENTLEPVWSETFDLPLSKDPLGFLMDALGCGDETNGLSNIVDIRDMLGFKAGPYDLNDVRVCYGLGIQRTRKDLKKWTERLQDAAKKENISSQASF